MMKLLVFAHIAEAQSFIHHLKLKVWKDDDCQDSPQKGSVLFSSGNHFFIDQQQENALLICKEGLFEAMSATSFILGRFPHITHVYNLGVAASCRSDIELGQIYSIRTLYGSGAPSEKKPFFKSFSTNDQKRWKNTPQADLISSFERVFDSSRAQHLSVFAPIVDREAYAIAWSCQLAAVPFSCAKIISDTPLISNEKAQNLCEMVKEQAAEYSEKLYWHYQNNQDHQLSKTLSDTQRSVEGLVNQLVSRKDLHFTFTSARRLSGQLYKLYLNQKNRPHNFSDIVEQALANISLDLTPKKRALELIQSLELTISPFRHKLQKEFKEIVSAHKVIKLHFDPSFESAGVHLSAKIQTPQELEQVIKEIKEIQFDKILELQTGNFQYD